MTTIKFTYMISMLWFICAGVFMQINTIDNMAVLGVLALFIGLVHLSLTAIFVLLGLIKSFTKKPEE